MNAKSQLLLVNREARFLKTVSQSLIEAGYPVLAADSKSAALDLLSSSSIALVICDSELSDCDGYDFLAYLKNNPASRNIPFIFLVSTRFVVDSLEEEVSKILKAFDMGAIDFIIDSMEDDVSRVLIKRINKILPADFREESKGLLTPPSDRSDESMPGPAERRDSKRIIPSHAVSVEISRDGVLWIPGQITNINEQGLKMETSLLGKLGMQVYIRVPLPGAQYVRAECHIRHISIIRHPSSAEIGVEADDSIEWIEIYNYIAKLMGIVKAAETKQIAADAQAPLPTDAFSGIADRPQERKKQYVYVDPVLHAVHDVSAQKVLENKFYRSLIGKQLGNYKAVSFIGSGSMAGVFKGWDVLLERHVALKVISYKLSAIPSFREMFIREARLVSRLTHPNIAQLYHIDQVDDVMYFIMELINGGTLADILKDRNKLSLAKCLEYFITTCRTLDFVSKQNIVHRDIKPANIMIDDRGVLKIVDFGIAIKDDGTGEERKPDGFGSPLYASPECIMGRPLDLCSDIYSLGATFYHVFAGVPPFEGDSDDIITAKHLNEQLVPLKKRSPMVSGDLSDIIGKMMAKKPQERYQSYRALANDLTEVVH
jgi:CheY-like chemotaxis protein